MEFILILNFMDQIQELKFSYKEFILWLFPIHSFLGIFWLQDIFFLLSLPSLFHFPFPFPSSSFSSTPLPPSLPFLLLKLLDGIFLRHLEYNQMHKGWVQGYKLDVKRCEFDSLGSMLLKLTHVGIKVRKESK